MRKHLILSFCLFTLSSITQLSADIVPLEPSLRKIYHETLKQSQNHYVKNQKSRIASFLLEFARYHASSDAIAKLEEKIMMGSKVSKVKALTKDEYAQLLCDTAAKMSEDTPYRQLLYYRVAANLNSHNTQAKEAISQATTSTSFSVLLKEAERCKTADEEVAKEQDKRYSNSTEERVDENIRKDYKELLETITFQNLAYSDTIPLNTFNFLIRTLYPYGIRLEIESKNLGILEVKESPAGVKYYFGPMQPTDKVDKTFKNQDTNSVLRYLCYRNNLDIKFTDNGIIIVDSPLVLESDMPRDGYRVERVKELYEEFMIESRRKFGKSRRRYSGYINAIGEGSRDEIYLSLEGKARVYINKKDFIGEDEDSSSVIRKKVFSYNEADSDPNETDSELDRLRRLLSNNRSSVEERKQTKKAAKDAKKRGEEREQHAGKNAGLYITFTANCDGLDRGRLIFRNAQGVMLVKNARYLTDWTIWED